MRYEITIQADNRASDFRRVRMVGRILSQLGNDLLRNLVLETELSDAGIKLFDGDGNHVGACRLVDETQEQ